MNFSSFRLFKVFFSCLACVSKMSCRFLTFNAVVHHGTADNKRTVGERVEIGSFEFLVEKKVSPEERRIADSLILIYNTNCTVIYFCSTRWQDCHFLVLWVFICVIY